MGTSEPVVGQLSKWAKSWKKRKIRKDKIRSIYNIPYDATVRCDECRTELELRDGCWHCKNCGFTKS